MLKQKLSNIKTKIRQHAPEITAGLITVGGVVAIVAGVRLNQSARAQTDPDRLAGPDIIVLENVGDVNCWRDMDEPDNYYSLNPA